MERPTFSPFWHRVRALRPRLRAHVQVTRQRYRGRRWHVAHDPGSNQFYRLSPVAYELVCLLDGRRDVETAWKLTLEKWADAAPTQNEVIELLGQLYNSNLLALDAPAETEQLLHRGRERARKRFQQQAIGIMYFRMRLINPDPLLTWLLPIFRPLLSRWGLLLWAGLVIFALTQITPQWARLAGGFDEFVSPVNAPWMLVTFVLLKLWHELGHGLLCKRFGGQVPEAGAMLLVLLPSPYVDASACWAFPSKWQRMAVGAGGMLFELFAAAVAALVWVNTPEGSFAKQLAYYVMLTSGISTVLFNANPLMRFDGYYMLADLLETPNLMQRSQQMIHHLFQRHLFRLKNARPPTNQPGERAILIIYGVLGAIYRVVLFLTITLFVLGQFFIVGVLLAAWTAAAWFLLPLGKFAHWLAAGPALIEKRGQALATSLAAAAVLAGLIGLVPLPDWRRAQGVIQSLDHTGVFFQTDGFVVETFKRPGEAVAAGDPLARLSSPELERALRSVRAELAEAAVARDQARAENDAPSAQIAQAKIEVFAAQLDELLRRESHLLVTAPHDGVVVGESPARLRGAFVRRGEALCEVVDPSRLRIAALLPQGDGDWFHELPRDAYSIQFRTAARVARVMEGGRAWSPQAAQTRLPHAALGYAGGGTVETDQRDEQGRVAKRGRFVVYIEPAEAGSGDASPQPAPGNTPGATPPSAGHGGWAWTAQTLGLPGERVHLRFTLPSKPLVAQVIDRVQKTLQGVVNL